MLEAAESPMAGSRRGTTPDFGAIKRSTLYAYLKESDDPVGSGDWHVIANVLRCVASLAERNGHSLDIDHRSWQRDWQRLVDQRHTRRSPSEPHSWIGSWDGAADAVLAHSSAPEFTVWPQGRSRLDLLSRAVAALSSAYEPRLAKEAAQRLVDAAEAELGAADPKALAARHALAFWTGETGDARRALELTERLLADCREHLGPAHILTRLAALREALWSCYVGDWHEANRRYIEVVSGEARHPDRDPHVWLLARWGMARTGGRTGNWRHADLELADLLPSVVETFGADHPATFGAEAAHAWAAGRAGRPAEACSRLEGLAARAETALGPDHPISLRIRTASAHWTHAVGSTAKALRMAASAREACESLVGTAHPLSIQAAEVESLCLLETDAEAGRAGLSDVQSRMRLCLGPDHPQTLQAVSNLAAARATGDGSGVDPGEFEDIAERMGHALGEEHPDTLRTRANVAIAVLNRRGAAAALPLFRRTYSSFRKVLGDDHPETVTSRDLLAEVEEQIGEGQGQGRGAYPPVTDSRYPSGGASYYTGFHGGEAPSSDSAVKRDIDPVVWSSAPTRSGEESGVQPDEDRSTPRAQQDGFDILAAVASLPVSTWSYRGEEGVRHLGPMAQDWYAAFGLGADDRSIHVLDANGVAIVAMQALHRMVRDLQQEVESLRNGLDAGGGSKGRKGVKRMP
ncbi:tetratricopeptide repeat protein [Streptomyces parvus]|uniref:Tetratricopeptide repeat protein n=1 Tax=Streptomyces parvus TaxID=66428 RepID=A0A5D4IRK7_9ACTN|nr:tetratricopeptide repeat protein [Streptomyces parvus]TYR55767.1 tetratricopeptide repeat protein [Streptomyces parvus]